MAAGESGRIPLPEGLGNLVPLALTLHVAV